MAHGRADAVGAGIAAAHDDDMFILGRNEIAILMLGIEQALGIGAEKIHRHMNALELPTGNRQIARLGRARADDHGIEVMDQLRCRPIHADMNVGDKLDAFSRHEIDAPTNKLFVELHVRDAVHQQTADPVGALVHGNQMAGAIELRCARQPRGPGPDHRNFFSRAFFRRLGANPALQEAVIDDRGFDIFNRHRQFVEPQHAAAFAGRRTNPAGKFRKIVGLVQALQSLFPQAAIYEIVPLGNEIVDRAARRHAADQLAGVTKGNTAIHAARALLL